MHLSPALPPALSQMPRPDVTPNAAPATSTRDPAPTGPRARPRRSGDPAPLATLCFAPIPWVLGSHLPGHRCGGSGWWQPRTGTCRRRRASPTACRPLLPSGFPPAVSGRAQHRGREAALPRPTAACSCPCSGHPYPTAPPQPGASPLLSREDLGLTSLRSGEGAAAASALSVTLMSAMYRGAGLSTTVLAGDRTEPTQGAGAVASRKQPGPVSRMGSGAGTARGSDMAREGTRLSPDITCWRFQDEFLRSHRANQLL